MSLFPIRVDGTIQCQTAQQLEQHAFSYAGTASTAAPATETASLHSLVDLLTTARNDSNRFFTSMIAKYPRTVDKGGRKGRRVEDEQDETAEDEQDDGPQLDQPTSTVTAPLPTDAPVSAMSNNNNNNNNSTTATSEPETKRAKLHNQ